MSKWSEIAKGDEERLGVSRDMLKRLLEVNPSLKNGKNTEDVLKDVKGALKPAQKTAPAKPHSVVFGSGEGDTASAIVARIGELEAELTKKQRELDAQIQALQAKRAAEATRVREILKSLETLEPVAFASPVVQAALKEKHAWLVAIGAAKKT